MCAFYSDVNFVSFLVLSDITVTFPLLVVGSLRYPPSTYISFVLFAALFILHQFVAIGLHQKLFSPALYNTAPDKDLRDYLLMPLPPSIFHNPYYRTTLTRRKQTPLIYKEYVSSFL